VPDRPLRADARRNREKVLAAAREVFEREGHGVPLDDIARAAGVGPGTVYRHFPTKDALFAAVVEERVRDLEEAARAGAAADDPGAAFFAFLDRVTVEAGVKHDLADALTAPTPSLELLADLRLAVADLLGRAQEVGAVRAGLDVDGLFALVKGLVGAPEPALGVLAEVVKDGLRARE
jgi:AcrR family transcriptional regulator